MSPFDSLMDSRREVAEAMRDLRLFSGGQSISALRNYLEKLAALYLVRMKEAGSDEEMRRLQASFAQVSAIHRALLPDSNDQGECR